MESSLSGIDKAHLDLSYLHSLTDGDLEADKELTGIFIKQADANLQTLSDNCRGGTHVNWQETAHKLKGSAASMGALVLSRFCDEAQRISDSADVRSEYLTKIEREYDTVKACLEKAGLLS
jgi:HPt (histidine-containing phosphotransfer) domain-containing protein